MLITLKILHYLGFSVGVGSSVSAIIVSLMLKSEPAIAGPVLKRLGRVSFSGLIVLWITGLWLYSSLYSGGLGPYFTAKMIAVAGLTCAALLLQYFILKGPTSASPSTRLRVSLLANAFSVLAIIFALLTFG